MRKELILKQFEDVRRTKVLLEDSVSRFHRFDPEKDYSSLELEFFDSLSFRFEKCVEITINFFRSMEIFLYAKTSETLRDRLLIMQKIDIIDDIDFWMEARLLRNRIAHTYLPEDVAEIYQEIFTNSPGIFKTIVAIENYLKKEIPDLSS